MENKEIIDQYIFDTSSRRGLSASSRATMRFRLGVWSRYLSFETMGIDDIFRAKVEIERIGYKQNSYRFMLHEFKRFCLWRIKKGTLNIDPEAIREIKIPAIDRMTKTSSDMLSEKEIESVIQSATCSRDRAMLAVMYAGRTRPIELLSLTWGDLIFDDYGVIMNTSKKTGVPRRVRLLGVKNYLSQWRADSEGCGFSTSKDMPVFVSLRSGKAMSPRGLLHRFDFLKKKFPDKNLHPYLLRHSKITQMVADGIPESAIKLETWGTLSTNMLSTYAHLTGAQTDELILDAAGIKKTVRAKKKGPILCERCFTENVSIADRCIRCGLPLSEKARQEEKAKEDQLVGRVYERVKADWNQRLGLG